jgi:MFS family permease
MSEQETFNQQLSSQFEQLECESLLSHSYHNDTKHDLDFPNVDRKYMAKIKLVNDALQDIGMGRFQWTLFFVTGLGWFFDNFWMFAISLISLPVKREFHIDKIGYLIFYKYIGLILGSGFWPLMADIYGRSIAFNFTLFMSGVSGLLAGFMPSYSTLNFMMICIGFATGGNQPVDSMLFIELIPASHQHLLLYESAFWGLGLFSAAIIGWPFVVNYTCGQDSDCRYNDNLGWRYAYWTYGVMTLVLASLRRFAIIYESPKFYISKGNNEKAVLIVQSIAARNNTQSVLTVDDLDEIDQQYGPDLFEHQTTSSNHLLISKYLENYQRWKLLFQTKELATTTSLLWMIWGLCGLAFPLFSGFLPFYLQWKGQTGNENGSNHELLNITYRNYAIQAIFSIPSGIIGGYLANHKYVGRKRVGLLGGVSTGIFMYLFIYSTPKKSTSMFSPYLFYNCMISFVTTFIYGAMYSYTPEIYPVPLRGIATATCSVFNRVCGLIGPIISLYLNISNGQPVFLSGALFMIAGLLFLVLPYETRGRAAS